MFFQCAFKQWSLSRGEGGGAGGLGPRLRAVPVKGRPREEGTLSQESRRARFLLMFSPAGRTPAAPSSCPGHCRSRSDRSPWARAPAAAPGQPRQSLAGGLCVLVPGPWSPSPAGRSSWRARHSSTGSGGGEGSRRDPENHQEGRPPRTGAARRRGLRGLLRRERRGQRLVEGERPRRVGVRGDGRRGRRRGGRRGTGCRSSAAPAGGRRRGPTSSSSGAPGARAAGPPAGTAGWPREGHRLVRAAPRSASCRYPSQAEAFSVWEQEGRLLEGGFQGLSLGARP